MILQHSIIRPLFLLAIFLHGCSICGQTISGTVFDNKTKLPMSFVQIAIKDTYIETMSNEKGEFTLNNVQFPTTIEVRFIGYQSQEITIESEQNSLKVYLEESNYQISEVVIKPDYSYDLSLLKKIIENRELNNPDNFTDIIYQDYRRLSLFFRNMDKERVKKSKFLNKYADALIVTSDSTVMIPLMVSEKITYHEKNSEEKIDISEEVVNEVDAILPGVKQQVEKFVSNQFMTKFNFYDNQLNMLTKGFPCPISSSSRLYYNVYVVDSIVKNDIKYYKFEYYPKEKGSTIFQGSFWVDSRSWALTEITATLPNFENLNYVKDLHIVIEYQPTDSGRYFYKRQNIQFNLTLINSEKNRKDKIDIAVNLLNTFSLSNIGRQSIDELIKNKDNLLKIERDSASSDTITSDAYQGLKKLKSNRYFKLMDKMMGLYLFGYLNVGPIDIGDYLLFYRQNAIEGHRFSIPLRTSEKLLSNFTVGGYIGYGIKNKEFAYGVNIGYEFATRQRLIMMAKYYDDYKPLTQNIFNEFIQENPFQQGAGNLISLFTNFKLNPYLYRRKHVELKFDYDLSPKLRMVLSPAFDRYVSNENVEFTQKEELISNFNTQTLLFDLRFSNDQKYHDGFFSRIYYANDKPVYHFLIILGRYELSNEQYTTGYFANLNISFKKRFDMGIANLMLLTEVGGMLGDVPFPLLNLPQGNPNLGSARYHFNLLDNASFISDLYLNAHLTLNTGGILFNRIPWIQKLKMRGIFGFKMYYGFLLGNHDKIIKIPDDLHVPTIPYMELSAGIANILKCFRIEYVLRLNTNKEYEPFSYMQGIRMRIEFGF